LILLEKLRAIINPEIGVPFVRKKDAASIRRAIPNSERARRIIAAAP
jgi:hypothetical protein